MKNTYYVDKTGNVQGPVNHDQLKSLHKNSQISAVTQICFEGTEEWLPYHKATEKGLFEESKKEHPSFTHDHKRPVISPTESIG